MSYYITTRFCIKALPGFIPEDVYFDTYTDFVKHQSSVQELIDADLCANEDQYAPNGVLVPPVIKHCVVYPSDGDLDIYYESARRADCIKCINKLREESSFADSFFSLIDFDCSDPPTSTTLLLLLIDFYRREPRESSSAQSIDNNTFPSGHWYMCTLTNKDTDTETDCLERHAVAMEYFKQRKIQVYAAFLEKSNIFHVHYVIRSMRYLKNETRDLLKLCKRHVFFSPRVNSLKKYQGLMKYVSKREYTNGKEDTCVRPIFCFVTYTKGEGYILDPSMDKVFIDLVSQS